ncbi:MAG: D-alanyl-D-alanine carboxypeptidase family protein [Eubacteriales bacterium]|nr:D-alanyl-D-alanine carboxypeptidase family protein [Eubacteriales bacterium]
MKNKHSIYKIVAAGLLSVVLAAVPVCAASQVNLQETYEISTNSISGWPQGPEIVSDTGIVMDADTGVVLYEKGADALRYPASIVKLMTLLVAVENSSLDAQVTFTETCLRDVTPDSANIGMVAGEIVSMEECLYAMMLASANEVSTQIAEFVGGTEENFINMMNERAQQLGCVNTRFINANGLPGEGQYTTARDMAVISQACFENETARKIIETQSHTMPATNMNASERPFSSHHPMIYEGLPEYYYEGCLGGKTGNTNDAGSTLVSFAKRGDITYIVVVLRAVGLPESCFDTAALFDYAYDNFEKKEIEGRGAVTVPTGTAIENLETKDIEQDGKTVREYSFQGRYVGNAPVPEPSGMPVEEVGDADEEPLYRAQEKEETGLAQTGEAAGVKTEKTQEPAQEKEGISDLAKFLFIIMGMMLAVLVILLAALTVKKKKRIRRTR